MTTSSGVTTTSWEASLDTLGVRGPDAQGQFVEGNVRFGHTRLAVIGLGAPGAQPMVSDMGSVLVYNGELYNFRSLAQDMGTGPDDRSDTEVLQRILDSNRTDLLSRLRGMYAFVHFDPTTQTVTALRDPMGIKPLYCAQDRDGQLTFGSTAAAVATATSLSTPDPVGIASFVALGVFSSDSTAFAGIRRLQPGILYRWNRDAGGWRETVEELGPPPESQLPLDEALRDSVSAHLVADVEVGVMLSGGVDSTLIAALAAEQQSPPIRTYTLSYPGEPQLNEADIARQNARLMGSLHTEVPASTSALAEQVSPLIQSSGEPFSDEAYLPLALLSQRIGADLKVALAGEGADELFGGYRRYDVEAAFDRTLVGGITRRVASLLPVLGQANTPMSQRYRTVRAARMRSPADRHATLMFGDWQMVTETMGLNATLAHRLFQSDWRAASSSWWSLNQPSNKAYDTRVWLPQVFLAKSDRASMLHGVEVRTPFIDPVMASVARRTRISGTSKAALRQILLDLLPGVALPPRKRGLDADRRALVDSYFASDVRAVLFDSSSVLQQSGLTNPRRLAAEASRSPALAFRLAMLGVWQREWL